MLEQLFSDTMRSMPLGTAALRLAAALLFGGIIGWEREVTSRAAGLRTHMLISLAAATFVIVGKELMDFGFEGDGAGIEADPIGLISAVTSGVAFLAAGSIIINGGSVRGVTTGASMWLCGAIGLACGIGDVALAGMATLMAVSVLYLIQILVKPVAQKIKDDDPPPPEDDR